MNQHELIKELAERSNMPQPEAKQFLRKIGEIFKTLLDDGKEIHLPGAGVFKTRIRSSRKGFHPTKKIKVMWPKKRIVQFKPSRRFRTAVNERNEP